MNRSMILFILVGSVAGIVRRVRSRCRSRRRRWRVEVARRHGLTGRVRHARRDERMRLWLRHEMLLRHIRHGRFRKVILPNFILRRDGIFIAARRQVVLRLRMYGGD